ncbi:MAG: hypothetical protein MI919_11405, partial [Holophagales bacterium]|nr:hypothetical protein [Holophagales bacterium]
MLHITLHASGLLLAGLAVWLPGYGMERLFFRAVVDRRSGAEGQVSAVGDAALLLATRWCLGLAFWTAGLFALAALGYYRPWAMVVWAVLGLGLAVIGRSHRSETGDEGAIERGKKAARNGGESRELLLRAGAHLLPAAVLGMATGSAFLLAINPTVSWDASTYHLTLPRLYLEAGGFRPVPMNVYSHWPLGTELLFGVGLAFGGPMLAKGIHLGFGLSTLLLLGLAAGSRARNGEEGRGEGGGTRIAAAWLAPALFVANGVVIFELRVAYVELAQAFYFLAGLLLVARAYEAAEAERRRLLLLTGLAAGLLAAVKVTGFVGSAILGLLSLPLLVGRAAGGRRAGDALALALPALVLALPWA